MEAIPFDAYGPGPVIHWHDSLTCEVRAEYAVWAARVLEDVMTMTWKGVPLIAEAKIGTHLHDMKPWKEWAAGAGVGQKVFA